MALKLYNETDIEAIADAIRGKNGSSDTYKVSEMADAIDDIPSGGGSGGDLLISRLNGTITSYASDELTEVIDYAFYDCDNLEEISLPNATNIGKYAFMNCFKLSTANGILFFPKLTTSGDNTFRSCSAVKYFIAPVYNGSYPSVNHCSSLLAIDINHSTGLNYSCWADNPSLDVVILRGSTLSPLQNANVFNNTPFASGKAGGTLYVPSALISSYQSATNWSTILGYANNQIKAIEGSIYETQYADGTSISS